MVVYTETATLKYKATASSRETRSADSIELEKMLGELSDDSYVAILLPDSLGRDSEPWMLCQ
eukprot:2811432-Pleurochrysis_carterae.AAC.1